MLLVHQHERRQHAAQSGARSRHHRHGAGEDRRGNLVSRASALAGTFGSLLKAAKKADAPAVVVPAVPPTPGEKKDEKKPEEKAAAPAVPASTTAAEKPAPAPTAAPVVAAPAGSGTAVNADVKAAGADEVVVPEFTPEFHAKIGSAMLQFAEGRDMVERCLRQLHGAEMAQDIIKSAAFMEEHALQLQQAELEGATAAEQLVSEMSADWSMLVGQVEGAGRHQPQHRCRCRIASRSELWCLVRMNGLRVRLPKASATSRPGVLDFANSKRRGADENRVAGRLGGLISKKPSTAGGGNEQAGQAMIP